MVCLELVQVTRLLPPAIMIADGLIHRLSVHAQFGLAGVGAIVADLHGGGIAPGENSVISMDS
jgi:hypothetical protein